MERRRKTSNAKEYRLGAQAPYWTCFILMEAMCLLEKGVKMLLRKATKKKRSLEYPSHHSLGF
jgi:hypothetical protein